MPQVKKAITAQNTWSDPFEAVNCDFNLSIWTGTSFVATVTVQRRIRGEDSTGWRDVAQFTSPTEQIISSVGAWEWQVGVKTGDFTSGQVNVSMVN